MDMKVYNKLPKEALEIRMDVFVNEQGFHDEVDEIDAYATHLVAFYESIPIATCRFFPHKSNEEFIIGRFAVIKAYRGQNIGAYLLSTAETEIKKLGGKKALLHAQNRAEKFYEKQGYHSFGEIELVENYPHIWMYKEIELT